MYFTISDISVKFVSAFKDRHDFPKFGEGKPYRLVTNKLRKGNSHKDRFSPIYDRTYSFAEIEPNFRIAKTVWDICTLEFLLCFF